jgi:hypothetical protein
MSIDMRAVIKSAERSMEFYNSLFPKEGRERMAKMANDAAKAVEPYTRMMQDPSFQRHLKEINRVAIQVSEILEKQHALTLPAIRAMEELYGVVNEASTDIAPKYAIAEEKREAVITRPIFSVTKLQIRSGIPSVKEILPLQLPTGTTWDDIQARFVDPHNLFIEIPQHKAKLTVDYKEMGMWDKRSGRPNAQWIVLRELARYDGEISWTTPIANDSVKKQKQLLSAALKRYFGIKDDPFGIYRDEKAYRLKMRLIPDADIISEKNLHHDRIGVGGYLDETMTSVYDPYENDDK